MTARRRHAMTFVALAAVFCGGWAAGRTATAHALARTDVGTPASGQAVDPATSCTDRLAMEANANLVGQVHDYRSRLTAVERRAQEAELERTKAAEGPPARLVTSRAEWARMAREGTIRVRVPCSRPDRHPRFFVQRTHQHGIGISGSVRTFEAQNRAFAAGLSEHELEALADAYTRTQARTWAAMRSVCEANAGFRESIENRDEEAELTDEARIDDCRAHLLDIDEPDARAGLARVAELHAAGAGIDRTRTDAQRVAFALTSSPAALFDEMVRVLGREKATRVIDNGVLCLDETLFDLRAGESDEG